MSPLTRWNYRLTSLAALFAAPLLVALPAESKAAECSCEAHFELRAPSNGRPAFDPSFKPDIPVDHFRARER